MRDLIGSTLGHYRIVDKIGEGGMGEVYRAHDERLDRDVAIKVLPVEVAGDPDRLARFEREAKALAALNHPNVATVYGLETTDSGSGSGSGSDPSLEPQAPSPAVFLVMELLEGESLREVIRRGGLTTSKAVEYATAIANGLAAAHDKGITHRDLKPENIFLTREGHIKILDFGLAKLKLPEGDLTTETPTATLDTAPGGLLGTVAYMAPEQVQGKPADHRSDIFALGVVLYEMLTGHRPFGGSTTVETAAAVLKEDPDPISLLTPGVSPALASVVSKCLEKRPEARFSSAHDLSLTLGAIDSAAPAPPLPRPSALPQRWTHVLAVVVAAVIGLLVILPPEALVDRLTGTTETPPIRSIALLPLENLTGDPEQEYFVDGLHEELIATFAQISAFDKVIARTSVMEFRDSDTPIREIARALKVDAVLEGSVRQAGDTVRATLQLIDARTEEHLWAGNFDRDLTDVLALQSDVARAVAAQVQLVLTPDERRRFDDARVVNPDAYKAYLKGVRLSRWVSGPEQLDQAVALFEKAIALDPEYAEPHVGLSFALFQLAHFYRGPRVLMPRAYEAAETSIVLDDDLAAAHANLGRIKLWWQWDWQGAEAELRRALELSPGNIEASVHLGNYLAATGRPDQAVAVARKAVELDPLNVRALGSLGWIYFVARRYDEGIEHMESTLELHPNDSMAHYDLAVNLQAVGRDQEAADEIDRMMHLVPGSDSNYLMLATVVWTHSRAGRTVEAAEAMERLMRINEERYVAPCSLALAYYSMGDVDQAIDHFETAFDVGDTQLFPFVITPAFDPLRSDPRIEELLRRLNLRIVTP